jgi:hypothetical protein
MPLYEYLCLNPSCSIRFTKLLPAPTKMEPCPKCGAMGEFRFSLSVIRGFPYIPRNHVPKEMGGDFDKSSPYWADANH